MEAQPANTTAPVDSVSLHPVGGAPAILQTDLQKLYDQVATGLTAMVANKPTTLASLTMDLKPIIVAIVNVVEDYSNNKVPPLDNLAKQALALNLVKYSLQQLNAQGKISNDLYANISASIDFLGPTIIDGCVAVFNKAHAVASDIEAHGCKGCCARNGCSVL